MRNKFYQYETLQGDTFDMIALDFYNDESLASEIIKSNPEYCSTIVFDAGIVLLIPIIEETAPSTLPPWKR